MNLKKSVLLWNDMVYFRVHKSMSVVPTLIQFIQVPNITP
jgi:hypothetical protein